MIISENKMLDRIWHRSCVGQGWKIILLATYTQLVLLLYNLILTGNTPTLENI